MADNQGSMTVVDIDEASARLIRDEGGCVVDHGEFSHVYLPVGTAKLKKDGVKLLRLPKGVMLTYELYRISYDEDMQAVS